MSQHRWYDLDVIHWGVTWWSFFKGHITNNPRSNVKQGGLESSIYLSSYSLSVHFGPSGADLTRTWFAWERLWIAPFTHIHTWKWPPTTFKISVMPFFCSFQCDYWKLHVMQLPKYTLQCFSKVNGSDNLGAIIRSV